MRIRQTLLFMAMILGLATATSCGSQSSPESMVSKAYDALIRGNYNEVISYYCFDDGTLPDSDFKDEFVKYLTEEMRNLPEDEKLVSYKIDHVDYNDENHAEVWLECTYADGHTSTEFEDVMKLSDGKWYICGDSNGDDYDEEIEEWIEDLFAE